MRNENKLKSFSDDELLRRLSELLNDSRRVEAELIVHLAEVDARRLFARYASSLFSYSTNVLHMSEYEALLRMRVARASRKYPVLLEMLADGRLHLSGIDKLAPIITEDNCETVLARAVHLSKREIEELVAEICPKPDVPPSIRKLPNRRDKAKPEEKVVLGPDQVEDGSSPQKDKSELDTSTPTPPPTSSSTKPAEVKPLRPDRYKVSFTASAGLRDKLERLQALMRSPGNDADLATVIEVAVTEKLEKLEAKRYGTTKSPRKNLEEADTSPSSRYISAPVRRAVYERDGGQCAYVDPTGRRCTETKRLEFHHIEPYGKNGDRSVNNVELRCREHNLYEAERDYGKEVMDRYRNSAGRVSEPAAVYNFGNRATSERGVVPASP
jgi:hypothetical protein